MLGRRRERTGSIQRAERHRHGQRWPCPGGGLRKLPGPDLPAILIHECLGDLLDFWVAKNQSAICWRVYMSKEKLFSIQFLTKEYLVGEVLVPALRGIDFTIHSGELLVILGPSCSGKSTLLNIIGGLDVPTSGSVFFRQEDLSKYSKKRLSYYRRRCIGFVFQFYNLIPSRFRQRTAFS